MVTKVLWSVKHESLCHTALDNTKFTYLNTQPQNLTTLNRLVYFFAFGKKLLEMEKIIGPALVLGGEILSNGPMDTY